MRKGETIKGEKQIIFKKPLQELSNFNQRYRKLLINVTHLPKKKWQPAKNEGTHNNTQCPRRFVFSLHLHYVLIFRGCVQITLGVDVVQS